MADGKITYDIGLQVDQSDLSRVKKALSEIQNLTVDTFRVKNNSGLGANQIEKQIQPAIKAAKDVEEALAKAFNPRLGITDLGVFDREIKKTYASAQDLYDAFAKGGVAGRNAYKALTNELSKTNTTMKKTQTIIDKMGDSLMRTIQWNISSSVINQFSNSLQQAYGFVKHLDSSLNDIRIVTEKSAAEMDNFASKAMDAAQALGRTTTDYTEGSLIYFQQGLEEEDVIARTEATLKAANVTGQSTSAVAEQLTSVWNGYKISADGAELAVDQLAAVGAATASDLEELAKAMSKVASAANAMGVGQEQLAAQLATIISATREAPESVGTMLKTVYARMSDIQAGLDEEGTTLGTYSGKMSEFGVQVLDTNGKLRDMGAVIEEVGSKWSSMTREQQISLAQTMGGARQYSKLIALFDNWDQYVKTLEIANNAQGTLQKQQDIYMESTSAKLNQVTAEFEKLFAELLDSGAIKTVADVITTVIGKVNDLVNLLGGGRNALLAFGGAFGKVFSPKITAELIKIGQSMGHVRKQIEATNTAARVVNEFLNVKDRNETDKEKEKIINEKQKAEYGYDESDAAEFRKDVNKVKNFVPDNVLEALNGTQQAIDNYVAKAREITVANDTIENSMKELGFSSFEQFKERLKGVVDVTKLFSESNKNLDHNLKDTKKNIQSLNKTYGEYKKLTNSEKRDQLPEYFEKVSEKAIEFKENIDLLTERMRNVVGEDSRMLIPEEQRQKASKLSASVLKEYDKLERELAKGNTTYLGTFMKNLNESYVIYQGIVEEAKKFGVDMDHSVNAVEKNKKALEDSQQAIDNAVNQGNQLIDEFVELEALSSGFVEGLSGISSLFGSTDAFSSAIGELTSGNFSQGISQLTASLTSLKFAYDGLKKVNGDFFKALGKSIIKIGEKTTVVIKNTVELIKNSIAIARNTAAENADVAATTRLALVKNVLAGSLKNVLKALWSLIATNPTFWIMAAVAAIIKIWEWIQKANDQLGKAKERLDAANESLDNAKSQYDEVAQSIKSVTEEIIELNSQDTLTAAEQERLDLLERQKLELQTQLQIKEQMLDVAKEEQAQAAIDYYKKGGYDDTSKGKTEVSTGEVYTYTNPNTDNAVGAAGQTNNVKTSHAKVASNDLDAYQEQIDAYDAKIADGYKRFQKFITEGNQEQADLALKSIQQWEAQKESFMKDWSSANNKYASQQAENLQGLLDTYNTVLKYDPDNIELLDEISSKFTNLAKQAGQLEGFLGDAISSAFSKAEEGGESIMKVSQIVSENYEEMMEDGKVSNDELERHLGGYSKYIDDIKEIIPLTNEAIIEFLADEEAALALVGDRLEEIYNAEDNYNTASQAASLEDSILSDKKKTKKELEAEGEILQDLESKYEDLRKIQDKGSHEYLNRLREIQELEEDNALENLNKRKKSIESRIAGLTESGEAALQEIEEKAQEIFHKTVDELTEEEYESILIEVGFDFEKNGDKLKEYLADIEKTDYQIKIAADIDLASDVDQAFGLAREFEDLAQLVDQSLEISFDKAQELISQGHGAILQGAQETAEATIKLNENTTRLYIEGKQAELNADKVTRLDQLEMQRQTLQDDQKILDAKLQALGNMLTAKDAAQAESYKLEANNKQKEYELNHRKLSEEVKDEGTATELKGEINTKLAEQLGLVQEEEVKTEKQAEEQGTDIAKRGAQDRINYWKAAHQQAQAYAKQVAVADEGVEIDIPDFSGNLESTVSGAQAGGFASGLSNFVGGIANTVKGFVSNIVGQQTSQSKDIIKDAFDQGKGSQAWADYEATIQAIIKQTQGEKDSVNAQLGAVESAIAALKSANNNLDQYKANLGKSDKDKSSKDKTSKDKTSKEKESKQIDYLEDEVDRYHDINIEIENITRNITRLQKEQERLTGKDLIDNLNKQLDILEKQKKAYQDKINLMRVELAEERIALSQAGAQFDSNGQISNYTKLYMDQLNKVNGVIAQYNAMSAEQQEATGDAMVEAAKKSFEDFKKSLSRYEELLNKEIPDMEDQIREAFDKQIELQVKKFTMEVEVRLNLAEAQRDWNEFKKKIIDGIKDDDYVGIIKSQYDDLLSYFNTADSGKGPIQALTEQITGTLQALQKIDQGDFTSAYGDNKALALEDLKKYFDELTQQLMNIEDLIGEIEQSYINMIKKAKDAFDDQMDSYKLVDDIIEHNKNVVSLIYGDKAYEKMEGFYNKQEENNNKQLDFLRQEAKFWEEKMKAEEEGSEAWKAYKENWEDAIGNLNSLVESSIENLIDKYKNLIDKTFDNLNDKITGGLGLDYVGDEWDLINKNADEYLDTINRSFEIQKLQNKFQDALANNPGLKAQQQIKDLMDQQLGDLEQRDKLTQYDVERAEKMLDIEIKRIALQDAQQNKSKMRLRRDSQGNYSYQFVSDEDKVLEAQRELAAAQNELYNFDKDRYKNNLDEIYSIYNEFQEKLKELYDDTSLSDEERERRKALLIEQYGELINAKTEQNAQIRLNLEESAFQELANLYKVSAEEFRNMTQEQRDALMTDLIPYWDSGVQQMVDKFAGEGGFIETCGSAFKDLEQITKDYIDGLDQLGQNAGINFEQIANGQMTNIDLAEEMIEKNKELIDQYGNELAAVQSVLDKVKELAEAYNKTKLEAISASNAAFSYWQNEQKMQAAKAEQEKNKYMGTGSGSNTGNSSGNSSGSTSGSGAGGSSSAGKTVTTSNIRVGESLKFTGGTYYYDSQGTAPTGNRGAGGTVVVENINPKGKYPIAVKSANSAYGWLLPSQLQKLKTGGYTGEWSSDEGKLGILHKKELVLNESDTKNILDTVQAVRSFTDFVGNSAFTKLIDAVDRLQVTPAARNLNSGEQEIKQNVHIDATFPNVTDAHEAEKAIMNLVNTASQYAMKH